MGLQEDVVTEPGINRAAGLSWEVSISALRILILLSCVGPTELVCHNRRQDVNIHQWRFRSRLKACHDVVGLFFF